MNILIINGSPKGKSSVTFQTPLFLSKHYPEHNFDFLHAGQRVKALEKDFKPAIESIEKADLLVFSYPIYTMLAPSQLHQFISQLKASGIDCSGKYAAQITTSIHFYDMTGHKYIEENCADLGIKYVGGFSSHMEDLLVKKGQTECQTFFKKVLFDVENDHFINLKIPPTCPTASYTSSIPPVTKGGNKDVLLVTSYDINSENDNNIRNMVADFKAACTHPVREFNLRDFNFSGGCIGCLNCMDSEKCIYKDNFDTTLREEIQTADAIIYGFTIQDHYTHHSFKMYDDRQFCNGHRAVTAGMPVGYLISGNYLQEHNLQTIVDARCQVGGTYLCGVATDELDTKKDILDLASNLDYALNNVMDLPKNFYGVGGTKIFRDMVYLMKGMMRADHLYYKKHGIYDFPQQQKAKMLQMTIVGMMMRSKYGQKEIKAKMKEYILMPYTKIIDAVQVDQT